MSVMAGRALDSLCNFYTPIHTIFHAFHALEPKAQPPNPRLGRERPVERFLLTAGGIQNLYFTIMEKRRGSCALRLQNKYFTL